MLIESAVQVLGPFPTFPQSVVREEVSQPRVSIAEAMSGGPIHRAFIERLPADWRDDPTVEIFSRSLWLKPGWYPLTPHFHFDWGRGSESTVVETIMVCLGDASLTEFILGPLDLPEPSPQPGGMHRWDDQVEAGLRAGTLRRWRIEPEQLIRFDNRALHRARPSAKTGWRLLVRAIRGLGASHERHQESGYGKRSPFTTSRNGFIPETADEHARYQPYRE
jgi:hypothetical protein